MLKDLEIRINSIFEPSGAHPLKEHAASRIAFFQAKSHIKNIFAHSTELTAVENKLKLFYARLSPSFLDKQPALQALYKLLETDLNIDQDKTIETQFFVAIFEALFNKLANRSNPNEIELIELNPSLYCKLNTLDDCIAAIDTHQLIIDFLPFLRMCVENPSISSYNLFDKLTDSIHLPVSSKKYHVGSTLLDTLIASYKYYKTYKRDDVSLLVRFITKLLNHPNIVISNSNESDLKKILFELVGTYNLDTVIVGFINALTSVSIDVANLRNDSNRSNPPILSQAAERGHVCTIKRLIELGARINEVSGPRSKTALMEAAKHGQFEAMHALLDCHADPNISDQHNATALYELVFWSNIPEDVRIVERLLLNMSMPAVNLRVTYDIGYSESALEVARNNRKTAAATAIYFKTIADLPLIQIPLLPQTEQGILWPHIGSRRTL